MPGKHGQGKYPSQPATGRATGGTYEQPGQRPGSQREGAGAGRKSDLGQKAVVVPPNIVPPGGGRKGGA